MSATPAEPTGLADRIGHLRRLASSEDESTRRTVATRLGDLMEHEFDVVFAATHEWALDGDDRLRQVACLACDQHAATLDEVRLRRLLGRIELFMPDASARVTRTWTMEVAPHLVSAMPHVGLPWIKEWTKDPDETVRVGVATMLGALSDKFPTEAVEGLAEISIDPRPAVRAALHRSLEQIRARQPGMSNYLRMRFAPSQSTE
jgi:hypothetical protein